MDEPIHPHAGGGALILLLATALWGTTFIAIQKAQDSIAPSVLNLSRFALAAVALSPFLRWKKQLWRAAAELGVLLFAGYATQAVGLLYTNVNRSAFITAMNVIFVPVLAAVAGRGSRWIIWVSAAVALIGCGLLCYDGSRPNRGDLWTLACAIIWALYIVRLETHSHRHPSLHLAAAQVMIVVICCGFWVAVDHPVHQHMPWAVVLYLGLGTTAITTILQTIGQRSVPAPQASIIFTLEPVFAAIFAFLLLRQMMGGRGLGGAAMIVAAAVACQIVPRKSEGA